MTRTKLQSGHWCVECLPEDGARIASLQFDGREILTTEPGNFHPPTKDYGRYETRPVYGYDDCFPTIGACRFPTIQGLDIPDHGELCWLPWRVKAGDNYLDCSVQSTIVPICFRRKMIFGDSSLQWQFEVTNKSNGEIPFLHAMHPLMPPDQVAGIQLPEFDDLFDETNGRLSPRQSATQVSERLLNCEKGLAEMLLLRKIKSGKAAIAFCNGLGLEIAFPVEIYPTLGIWWNNAGYPDEDGCRRIECAIEPISATTGSLEAAYADGVYLSAPADGRLEWEVNWNIKI